MSVSFSSKGFIVIFCTTLACSFTFSRAVLSLKFSSSKKLISFLTISKGFKVKLPTNFVSSLFTAGFKVLTLCPMSFIKKLVLLILSKLSSSKAWVDLDKPIDITMTTAIIARIALEQYFPASVLLLLFTVSPPV